VDGALAELGTQAIVHRLLQARLGARLVAADADVVLLDVDNAPFHEGIHQHVLLFRGDETFRLRRVHGKNPRIEIAHVLHQRQLEVKSGAFLDRDDLAQLENDRILALVHGEHEQACHDQRPNQTDHNGTDMLH